MLNPLIYGNSISVYAHQPNPQGNDWIASMLRRSNREKRYLDKLIEIARRVHEGNQRLDYYEVKRNLSASITEPTTASFDVIHRHHASNGWVRGMNLRQCNCYYSVFFSRNTQ